MSRLQRPLIEQALSEADQWENFKDGATFSGALMGAYALGFGAAPFLAVPAAAAASMILLGGRKARAARWKATDPPDPVYWIRVRPRRQPFYEDAFRDWPLAQATIRASRALIDSIALEEATVRADERASGAREAGAEDEEQARLQERDKYVLASLEADAEVETATKNLATELRDSEARQALLDVSLDELAVPRRLDEALPDEALVLLFRAGFRIEGLRVRVPRPEQRTDPIASIADGLEKAGAATGEFGRALRKAIEGGGTRRS